MTCEEAGILLHALADGELDAVHAREVEAHIAGCTRCASKIRQHRELSQALSSSELHFTAPPALRQRIEDSLPAPPRAKPVSRRYFVGGFAVGGVLSAAAAASVAMFVLRGDQDQLVLNELVSAHLRSLQADRLTDVLSSDQHTVRPWFNGRLDVSPPVIALAAQGFTLIGGRLDYINAKPIAAIVYRRRAHVINLFVTLAPVTSFTWDSRSLHGFNIRRWTAQGFDLIAVSDINAEELQEFVQSFNAQLQASEM